jgi:hypothetical protein
LELCTLQQFSTSLHTIPACELQQAFVACVTPELRTAALGKGSTECPDLQNILDEFSDVLVPTIPGGLPPVRDDIAGRVIEHTINSAYDEKPYARPPRTFTPDESAEIQRVIADFLAKGWITPSLSAWAAPVLFLPKRPAP